MNQEKYNQRCYNEPTQQQQKTWPRIIRAYTAASQAK